MTRIEWVQPDAPPKTDLRLPQVRTPEPPPLRGYLVGHGAAAVATIRETMPQALWTLEARLLAPCDVAGHWRPTTLHQQATCASEAAARAEAEAIAQRLLSEVAA
ncbi:hypothetical protein [Falsiruegeria mediterranea]|uniref:hypothetical protein n=1 Tax=Falsiruegeria mediterranea TaxID=1280832 RepID=UPI0015F26630|nr:hypothetical protein [Falsiruegeria mediterranea]